MGGKSPAQATPTPRPRATPTPTPTPLAGDRDLAIQTVVGTGVAGYSENSQQPIAAQLNTPTGLAINRGDSLIADSLNHRIRKLTYDGFLVPFVGTGEPGYNGDGRNLTYLQVNAPYKIVSDDATGLIFFSDRGNGAIRCIDLNNFLITIAGRGTQPLTAGAEGLNGLDVKLDGPAGLAFDSQGNLYVAEMDANRILKLDGNHSWRISVYAGTGQAGFGGDNGARLAARFNKPSDIAIDAQDNVYVADMGNHRIRKIAPDGTVSTLAGVGLAGFGGDGGPSEEAWLSLPTAVAVDNQGSVFVADSGNHRVRAIKSDGTITTLAGTGTAGYSGDGGFPFLAALRTPFALAYTPSEGLFVAERDNHVVRHFNVP
ncbi:Serine/threonine-protein kinase PknD [compost metagenome]